MMSRGETYLCAKQTEFLNSLDDAINACAGQGIDQQLAAARAEFLDGTSRCPGSTAGSATTGAATRNMQPSNVGSAVVLRERQAATYLQQMEQCKSLATERQIQECRLAATAAYTGDAPAGGSGAAGYATGASGASSGSSVGGPTEEPPRPNVPAFTPADPKEDFSGRACSYFTKPAIENSGARLNYYAQGSCVAYGEFAYECRDDGRWRKRGPRSVFNCADAASVE